MAGGLEHHDCMSDQELSDQRIGGGPETRQTVTEMKPVPRLSQAASPSFSRRFLSTGGGSLETGSKEDSLVHRRSSLTGLYFQWRTLTRTMVIVSCPFCRCGGWPRGLVRAAPTEGRWCRNIKKMMRLTAMANRARARCKHGVARWPVVCREDRR
jgi:hypothetical protein